MTDKQLWERREEITADPGIRSVVGEMVNLLADKDPVDARKDAMFVAAMMRGRCEKALEDVKARIAKQPVRTNPATHPDGYSRTVKD